MLFFRAKKSHEILSALSNVYNSIAEGELPPVPLHLRNSNSKVRDYYRFISKSLSN